MGFGFQNKLVVEVLADGHRFKLVQPLRYISNRGVPWNIPAGFVTDLASIPRIFWTIYPPAGRYDRSATLHDWLCKNRFVTRKLANYLFRESMQSSGVGFFTRWTFWIGVTIYGILSGKEPIILPSVPL